MKQITFSELKEQLNEWIQLDYIQPEDIPAIELYMDQITTFMDRQLHGNKRNEDDKILTKTMINNYSKNHLLPPSDKKKYSKDHIILLIYIYYLKNFLSIHDIQNLLSPMTDKYFHTTNGTTLSDIYERIFQLEQEYGLKMRENINDIYQIADREFNTDDDYLKIFSMVTMLSYDIYAKKQLVEQLIDSIQPETSLESSRQKEKSSKKK